MEIFTVSCFGHREIADYFKVEKILEDVIYNLILSKQYVEFLVGREGLFDHLVSSTVRKYKRMMGADRISLVLVLPYLTAEYENNLESFHEYYCEVEICDRSSSKYFKEAYRQRNRTMVDRSQYTIFYVEHPSGGAYQTMKYAERMGKAFINLADT